MCPLRTLARVVKRSEGQTPRVVVIDPLGEVFDRVRGLALPLTLFRVLDPAPLMDSATLDFAIVAANARPDWDTLVAVATRWPTLVLTSAYERSDALAALQRGLVGYLDLALPPAVLARSVRGVLLGDEPGFTRQVIGTWLREARSQETVPTSTLARLTKRQREIVALIAEGHTDKEIASRLGIAMATAQKHVTGLLRRLDVPNRAAAVAAVMPRNVHGLRGGVADVHPLGTESEENLQRAS